MNRTVMLIDQDEISLAELEELLEERKITTLISRDGLEAIEQLKSRADALPDLIFLCAELDTVNGFFICKKLKNNEQFKDIPLVITSKVASEETFISHKKLKARADYYLHKPVGAEDLDLTLETLLGWKGQDEDDVLFLGKAETTEIAIKRAGEILFSEEEVDETIPAEFTAEDQEGAFAEATEVEEELIPERRKSKPGMVVLEDLEEQDISFIGDEEVTELSAPRSKDVLSRSKAEGLALDDLDDLSEVSHLGAEPMPEEELTAEEGKILSGEIFEDDDEGETRGITPPTFSDEEDDVDLDDLTVIASADLVNQEALERELSSEELEQEFAALEGQTLVGGDLECDLPSSGAAASGKMKIVDEEVSEEDVAQGVVVFDLEPLFHSEEKGDVILEREVSEGPVLDDEVESTEKEISDGLRVGPRNHGESVEVEDNDVSLTFELEEAVAALPEELGEIQDDSSEGTGNSVEVEGPWAGDDHNSEEDELIDEAFRGENGGEEIENLAFEEEPLFPGLDPAQEDPPSTRKILPEPRVSRGAATLSLLEGLQETRTERTTDEVELDQESFAGASPSIQNRGRDAAIGEIFEVLAEGVGQLRGTLERLELVLRKLREMHLQ